MVEIELEKTYLAKALPKDLKDFPSKEIIDIYIPSSDPHPCLRLRKNGERLEITKKQPVSGTDSSEQTEHTIRLTPAEFSALSEVEGKKVRKIRYAYKYGGVDAEVDVFEDALKGLVLVDFEFNDPAKKDYFAMPSFCLADVTQDKAFAGGMLCGKSYSDVEKHLAELGYAKIG